MEKLKAGPPSLFVVDEAHCISECTGRLGMRHAQVVVWGFDRPNIWLGVEACPDEATKHRVLLQRVKDEAKPGIVYVATQAHAEELAADLIEEGVTAAFYHGGMNKADRDREQDAFMAD